MRTRHPLRRVITGLMSLAVVAASVLGGVSGGDISGTRDSAPADPTKQYPVTPPPDTPSDAPVPTTHADPAGSLPSGRGTKIPDGYVGPAIVCGAPRVGAPLFSSAKAKAPSTRKRLSSAHTVVGWSGAKRVKIRSAGRSWYASRQYECLPTDRK